MLRFLADEYDDTCSTVFTLLSTVLLSVSLPMDFDPLRFSAHRAVIISTNDNGNRRQSR